MTEAGWPDLLALKKNRIVFIEVKQLGLKPTKLQTAKIKQLRSKGYTALVMDKPFTINQIKQLNK